VKSVVRDRAWNAFASPEEGVKIIGPEDGAR
jgi:hypothetical protein